MSDKSSTSIGEKMNTTLLIMAAGIGSRFGTEIKQLEPVDDANHTSLMERSLDGSMLSMLILGRFTIQVQQ